tara:strand:+ start:566 stop:757 length:192 start_codon:yes stop_codon:yes gene_type:complete
VTQPEDVEEERLAVVERGSALGLDVSDVDLHTARVLVRTAERIRADASLRGAVIDVLAAAKSQ